jgi:TRAP-type C4-dicarboxylate transport system permease large subunit
MVFLQRCVHSMVVLIAALCTPTLVWGALQSGGVTANDPGAPMTYALVVGINSYRVLPVKALCLTRKRCARG